MSRILLAWELGDGYGHFAHLAAVASALAGEHQVVLVLRDERGWQRAAPPALQDRVATATAPPARLSTDGLPPARTYSDLLARIGYLNPAGLTGSLTEWLKVLDRFEPDLLIAEHAPTALLAGHVRGIARAKMGTGFCCPPARFPLPDLTPQPELPSTEIVARETAVRNTVNAVLASLGKPRLDLLGALYATEATLLLTYREIDPFAALRNGPIYLGLAQSHPAGEPPRWPAAGAGKLFGYLKPEWSRYRHLVAAIGATGHASTLHIPRLTDAQAAALESDTVRVSARPVTIDRSLEVCDLVIGHAGHGLTAAALLAGCPSLLIPLHAEQRLTAARVATLGAGIMANPASDAPTLQDAVARLLYDPAWLEHACDFASSYAEHRPTAPDINLALVHAL